MARSREGWALLPARRTRSCSCAQTCDAREVHGHRRLSFKQHSIHDAQGYCLLKPGCCPASRTWHHLPSSRWPQAAGWSWGGRAKRSRWCSCSWVLPRRSRGETQEKAAAESRLGEPRGPSDSAATGVVAAAAEAAAVAGWLSAGAGPCADAVTPSTSPASVEPASSGWRSPAESEPIFFRRRSSQAWEPRHRK